MSPKKKKLISYGVHAALVLAAAVMLYLDFEPRLDLTDPLYKVYIDVPQAWQVRCWSDALFIPGVLLSGLGGLMWIATTGFFDLLRYAGHSLWMRFSPTKDVRDLESFYDYKLLRAEARVDKPVNHASLISGLATLLAAFILAMINLNMIGG